MGEGTSRAVRCILSYRRRRLRGLPTSIEFQSQEPRVCMHASHTDTPRRRAFRALPLVLLLAAVASPAGAQLAEPRSTLDGVYTNEQADLGAQVYQDVCSKC